jgi:hypothetical protein
MPRVRITARGRVTLTVLAAAGALASAALAAPPGAAGGRVAPPPGTAGARPGETEGRRRDEIEAAQRQDVAESLKKHFNIDIDWRTTPLDRLIDIRVRAAKAAELQQRLGVSVDWQRYNWIELEALRRTLLSFEHYRGEHPDDAAPTAVAAPAPPTPPGDDGLVRPTFRDRPGVKGRARDPDGVIRPTFSARPALPAVARDPDGVIRPTFAGRPRWSAGAADPDGLIMPTFAPFRRAGRIADADGVMDPSRSEDSRPPPSRW